MNKCPPYSWALFPHTHSVPYNLFLSQAPPGLEATQQGVFQGFYFGLGYGLGAVVGGTIAQRMGYPSMYLVGAGIVAGGWAVLWVGRRVAPNSSSSRGGRGGGHYAPVLTEEGAVGS